MKSILPILMIASCCTPQSATVPPSQIVRASLRFAVDGQKCSGTCVVQRKTSQKFTFYLPEKTKRVLIQTCHRQIAINNPARDFVYDYVPAMFLENWDECGLEAIATTQAGNVLVAMAEFTSNETLAARHWCNGTFVQNAPGVSFCQARVGLIQRIAFDEPVDVASGKDCPPIEGERSSGTYMSTQVFTYAVGKDLCIYNFLAKKKEETKFHRLVTRGYEKIEEEVVVDSQPSW